MNLQDLVDENATLEKLKCLVETPFDFDSKDVELISKIGMRHRKQFVGWRRAKNGRDLLQRRYDYDYSPENKAFASYCLHKLQLAGVSKDSLSQFEGLIELFEEIYTKNPNDWKNEQEPNMDQFRKKAGNLLVTADGNKIKEVIGKCREHFYDKIEDFVHSPNRQALTGTNHHDNIYMSAVHCISCVYDYWCRSFKI